jgi:transcriptional regulator with XRE-family HTH domain
MDDALDPELTALKANIPDIGVSDVESAHADCPAASGKKFEAGNGAVPGLLLEAPGQPFGELLRAERLRRGISQGELARMVNYSKSHLSRVESGEKRATEVLARVCDEALKTGDVLQRSAARGAWVPSARSGPKLSQLPIRPPHFAGRSRELGSMDVYLQAQLDRSSASAPVVIDGSAGAGKTALAVHWAYLVGPRFSDGVLFADLNGFGTDEAPRAPNTILEGFLVALGTSPESVPSGLSERAAMYRDALSSKQVLVILDNAASAEQARSLLGGSSAHGSLVMVTSRNRLSGLVIREGAHRVTLGALPPEEAVACIDAIARESGLRVEPETATRVAGLFGYLPLALSIVTHCAVARRDPGFTNLFYRLRNGSSPLDLLSIWGDESLAIRDSLQWSYRRLNEELAGAFRVIAPYCVDGGIDAQTVGERLGTKPGTAMDIMDALAETSLITRTDDGRYHCHALCGAFAAELAA